MRICFDGIIKMDKRIALVVQIFLLIPTVKCESLSFLGGENPADSRARYQRWNARDKGTLNFQFRTSKPDGILLYMDNNIEHDERAWSKSYIQLILEMGKLRLTVSHSPDESIAEELGTDLNDASWHNVTIIRNYRVTVFELDGMQRILTKLHWKSTLEVLSDLYVGNTPLPMMSNGFVGCIRDLKFSEGYDPMIIRAVKEKGINTDYGCYDYCERHSIHKCYNNGTCLNKFTTYECDCFGTGYEGKQCQARAHVISLRSNMDFISIPTTSVQTIHSNMVQIRFKTNLKDGILLTIGKSNGFFTLELYDGYLRMETNLAGGKVEIQNNHFVHDGLWHDVEVKQNGADFIMIVDRRKVTRFEKKVTSPYGHAVSNCRGIDIAYFGGHFNPITAIGSNSKQGFVGCLQQFNFNGINVIKHAHDALTIMKRNNGTHPDTQIDGTIHRVCTVKHRRIKVTPQKTEQPKRKYYIINSIARPTKTSTSNGISNPEASSMHQSPGARNGTKLQKSSVAWITAGLVIGALVIILVMAFLVHRFRKKYRGTFMAPRDENGMPYYSSVQTTYHMQNGVGKRHGRGNATDV